jgi:hypothetical protein
MNYILAVKLGIRARAGHHNHVTLDVRDGWLIGTYQSMPFAVPMVWREQKDHLTDCYFRLTTIDGHNSKAKHTTVYSSIPSALRPVEHDESLPIMHKNQPVSLQKTNWAFMSQCGS